jgi:hypothetical protein
MTNAAPVALYIEIQLCKVGVQKLLVLPTAITAGAKNDWHCLSGSRRLHSTLAAAPVF